MKPSKYRPDMPPAEDGSNVLGQPNVSVNMKASALLVREESLYLETTAIVFKTLVQ